MGSRWFLPVGGTLGIKMINSKYEILNTKQILINKIQTLKKFRSLEFKISNLFSFSILVFSIFGVLSSSSVASSLNNNLSFGYIKSGTTDVWSATWKPDFKFGAWAMGLDVNMPSGNTKPDGYDSLVLRYAEYNDGQKGLRYGMVDGATIGRGLLMKNYSSHSYGSIIQNNQQTALKGFLTADRIGLQFMSTWSHLNAFRITEKVNPMLTLGQSYITDTDGQQIKQSNGSTQNFPSVTGMAIDASVPLPLNFEGYAEYAQLIDHGSGTTVGINWGIDVFVFSCMFDAGYRFLDKKFAPGYFGEDYETNPINLASYEASSQAKDGYIAELKLLMSNILKANAVFESYKGSNASFMGNASTELDKATASVYFKQPNFQDFRSLTLEQGAVVGGSVGFKVNPNTTLITNYKKSYDPTLGKVVESQYVEVKVGF